MTAFLSVPMNRRIAFKVGAGLEVAGVAGALGYQVVPPAPSAQLQHVDGLARQLYVTLDPEQRADSCVPSDHPLRQDHNRGVWGGGREVLFGFSRHQRRILTDLMHAGLSAEGRSRVLDRDLTRWSGVNSMRVLICGDPAAPPYQIVMTGVHLNLRLGGASREGAAFGGPQVYGDQRGNERPGLPNNVYREQFVLARRLFQGMDAAHRSAPCSNAHRCRRGSSCRDRAACFPVFPSRISTPATRHSRERWSSGLLRPTRPTMCLRAGVHQSQWRRRRDVAQATTHAARTARFRKHRSSAWKARARCSISVATRTCTPSSTSRWTETRRSHPVSTSPTTPRGSMRPE